MNKKWMWAIKLSKECKIGIKQFVPWESSYHMNKNKIWCTCVDCGNHGMHLTTIVRGHLFR